MSKKRLTYPQDRPNSVQDITKSYIQQYFSIEVEKGNISAKQLEEWIQIVKDKEETYKNDSPVKAFNAYRDEFVKLYMPHLVKPEKASDFYAMLLEKAKQGQTKSEE